MWQIRCIYKTRMRLFFPSRIWCLQISQLLLLSTRRWIGCCHAIKMWADDLTLSNFKTLQYWILHTEFTHMVFIYILHTTCKPCMHLLLFVYNIVKFLCQIKSYCIEWVCNINEHTSDTLISGFFSIGFERNRREHFLP